MLQRAGRLPTTSTRGRTTEILKEYIAGSTYWELTPKSGTGKIESSSTSSRWEASEDSGPHIHFQIDYPQWNPIFWIHASCLRSFREGIKDDMDMLDVAAATCRHVRNPMEKAIPRVRDLHEYCHRNAPEVCLGLPTCLGKLIMIEAWYWYREGFWGRKNIVTIWKPTFGPTHLHTRGIETLYHIICKPGKERRKH